MIICSAIKKTNTGEIYIGRRHGDIILLMVKRDINPNNNAIQGFIDSDGKFLDREEAATHALQIGQIKQLKFQPKTLFSEDLY